MGKVRAEMHEQTLKREEEKARHEELSTSIRRLGTETSSSNVQRTVNPHTLVSVMRSGSLYARREDENSEFEEPTIVKSIRTSVMSSTSSTSKISEIDV